jgi:hypothetical protein
MLRICFAEHEVSKISAIFGQEQANSVGRVVDLSNKAMI